MRRRRPSLLGFGLGIAFIWAVFLPTIGAGGLHLRLDWRPPIVLAALLALLGLLGLARRELWAALRWVTAALILVLAGLQFADAAVERLLDRPLDLYFDLRHVPNLLGLYVEAAGTVRGVAVILAWALTLGLIFLLLVVAVIAVDRAMKRPNVALGSILAGLACALLLALPQSFGGGLVSTAAIASASHQFGAGWRAFAVIHGFDHRYDAALAAPEPTPGPLPGLKGRDVYLIFVESYGTVVLDEPAYHAVIAPALTEFASVTGSAGYRLVSGRLLSPTFGGGSWLAHGTIASGLKLDQLLSELVVNGKRLGLPRYLAAAGYRTVEVMPGIKKPYPEGGFWGFDRNYYAADLGYSGPEFGWFDIPDQFTLDQFSHRELAPGHAPLFAQIVLVSSHTPFAPVPPYLADWGDAGKFATVPKTDWDSIYASPNWNNLDRPYLESIAYDLKTLGQWLAQLDGSPLVIILGDHQPPELTRGAGEAWTVPIHVLSRDAELVRPFEQLGYVAGAEPPPRDHPEGMESFLGEFLAAYAPSATGPASALPQSPGVQAASQP